jgi:hypothetical protein
MLRVHVKAGAGIPAPALFCCWVVCASESGQATRFGGGGIGEKAGEGGSGTRGASSTIIVGTATTDDPTGGVGAAVETARSKPPVI